MLLLGIDIETTYDGKINKIIEIGTILKDFNSNKIINVFSFLISDDTKVIDSYVTDLTGIDCNMLKYGISSKEAIEQLDNLLKKVDYIVVHGGNNFDKKILEQFYKRNDKVFPQKRWIDTFKDIQYPKICKYKNLTYLAGFYNIISGGHRAVFDVLTMFNILSKFEIKDILKVKYGEEYEEL